MAAEARFLTGMGIGGLSRLELSRVGRNRQVLKEENNIEQLRSFEKLFGSTVKHEWYTPDQMQLLFQQSFIKKLWRRLDSGDSFFAKIKMWFLSRSDKPEDVAKLAVKVAALIKESGVVAEFDAQIEQKAESHALYIVNIVEEAIRDVIQTTQPSLLECDEFPFSIRLAINDVKDVVEEIVKRKEWKTLEELGVMVDDKVRYQVFQAVKSHGALSPTDASPTSSCASSPRSSGAASTISVFFNNLTDDVLAIPTQPGRKKQLSKKEQTQDALIAAFFKRHQVAANSYDRYDLLPIGIYERAVPGIAYPGRCACVGLA